MTFWIVEWKHTTSLINRQGCTEQGSARRSEIRSLAKSEGLQQIGTSIILFSFLKCFTSQGLNSHIKIKMSAWPRRLSVILIDYQTPYRKLFVAIMIDKAFSEAGSL